MLFPMFFYTALGFFSGSVPYSYALPKWLAHVDVRQAGEDHNPGAFNAFHACGPFLGVVCATLDVLKGAVPVYLAVIRGHLWGWYLLLPALAPVLGHAFSPFLHFRGGKAIAAFFGVLLGLLPVAPLLWMFILCILPLLPFIPDHALLMCASTSLFCLLAFALPYSPPVRGIALALGSVVFSRHRPQALRALKNLRARRRTHSF